VIDVDVKEFYSSLRSYLRVSATVTSKVGHAINVGEKFTLRVFGSNIAPASGSGQPHIIFLNSRVLVMATRYARPIGGDSVISALSETVLHPGQSSSVDIQMEALAEIPDLSDFFQSEDVARINIYADLDTKQFFRMWNQGLFYQEIDPKYPAR
jgi:hypothetical protein